MNNDLRKALELLRQARPRVEGMHLAQGCRADQGHIGLLREIDAFLASQQAEGAQGERVVQTAPERIYLIVGADCPRDADFSELAEVTWCEDDLDDGIEYVRADKARADLAQPSTKCPVCNDSGIMGHSDLCVACEPGDKKASPKCATCDDNGRIGGPSFYAPDEGGEPCPDCAQPSPAPELDDQEYDRNAERLTLQALGSGAGINPEATSIDDLFLDEAPAPGMERPEVVAWMWRDINGDMQFNYMHPEGEPLMTVAQHDRIVGALRVTHQCTMGVGSGDGQLFVHGDHASIKAAQKIVLERDAAQARVAELEKQKEFGRVIVSMKGGYKCFEFDEYSHAHGFPEGEHQLYAAPVAQAGQVPQAWLDVQAERRRQIEAEDWTPEHDDEHSHGQMARAAACYALAGSSAPNDGTAALLVSLAWPWDQQWWKPTTARRDLIKACALALAEIERLDRAAAPQPAGGE